MYVSESTAHTNRRKVITMCTALSFVADKPYFGRTLDLECSLGEQVLIVPRAFPFRFRRVNTPPTHAALIGIGILSDGYPLFYDAVNEYGLGMAGLNFPHSAVYPPPRADGVNVAPFELIPWVLGRCRTVTEAEEALRSVTVAAIPFSAQWPLSPLHWLVADKERSITVETVADGLQIYDNPVGVLTNEPSFSFQMTHLSHYLNLTRRVPKSRFADSVTLPPYCRGMGAMGLPGDLSSPSRFVRAAFTKLNAMADGFADGRSQFFHILGTVEQVYGCVQVENGGWERTVYTACCDMKSGIYYYTTYGCRQIHAVELHREALDGTAPVAYPLITEEWICRQN